MNTFQKLSFLTVLLASLLLIGCDDDQHIKGDDRGVPAELNDFAKQVYDNPTIIDNVKLGDSWRVTRYKYAYKDGDYWKRGDINYLDDAQVKDSENGDYKIYWVFGANELMQVYDGSCCGKDWNGYYEKSATTLDVSRRILGINYVKEDEGKNYIENWLIRKLTAEELILGYINNNPADSLFQQYTFRREKL